ncbi:DNA gyrase subunit A, chloroplastic/mitochondrial-like isoform X1 [Prunus avium]|uniref:DNA gyrase subunit A, chloroplastic/mitochondrial-like isoform X1 n=1 Tax=Prunus avium TaxID=42229 RepID=A0A6P5RHK4_PRUAV|nr:DNA gyrase subunit A, chloroplastic/mitochondrial-like isoform X1 [Prunus avium]
MLKNLNYWLYSYVELLDSRTKRSASIIKEIPHQTNKSAHMLKIAELVENKSLEGISDIRDESDRSGMHVVIEALLWAWIIWMQ